MRLITCAAGLLLLLAGLPVTADPGPHLDPVARSQLQDKLISLWSELDLAIRNRKSNDSDLQRQEREMDGMQVYQKMPLEGCPDSLRKGVIESARRFGIVAASVQVSKASRSAKPVPRIIYIDQGRYELPPDQLVDTYIFNVHLKGLESALKDWSDAWISLPMPGEKPPAGGAEAPYLEAKGAASSAPADEVPHWRRSGPPAAPIPEWQASLQGFCFRKIRFPQLRLRDPAVLLPAWARKDPARFAEEEPGLAARLKTIRALIPEAQPLYASREQFLLNDARWGFFTRKMNRKEPAAAKGTPPAPPPGR